MIPYGCNYDDVEGRTVRLCDEQIAIAMPFIGHQPEFLKWPEKLWHNPAKNVPCLDPAKNAWHVRYLSELMRVSGWVGDPFVVNLENHCWGGNHRVRAAKYLLALGIFVGIPPPLIREINPGSWRLASNKE
jgi:hypothetical protein